MESPPSFSTHSEVPPLSDDSGLLITSGSFSSDSASGWHHVASELQESDFDERSLSLCESTETSERMCGDFFNTVKKGPSKVVVTTIEPPPEFQDNPIPGKTGGCTAVFVSPPDTYSSDSVIKLKLSSLNISVAHASPISPKKFRAESLYERRHYLNHRFASPRLLHLSPCRANRPSSRSSLSSRLSSSHNSLVAPIQADDSSFITQAISHDTLSGQTSDITDLYNVPFDSDIYAVPIDMVRPNQSNLKSKGKKPRNNKKRGKSTPQNIGVSNNPPERNHKPTDLNKNKDTKMKRHSLPSSSSKKNVVEDESLHLTLREMRRYLHTLYANPNESEFRHTISRRDSTILANVGVHSRQTNTKLKSTASTAVFLTESIELPTRPETNNNHKKKKNAFGFSTKNKKNKDVYELDKPGKKNAGKMSPVKILSINLKQSFCNMFHWRRDSAAQGPAEAEAEADAGRDRSPPAAVRRALPPVPEVAHGSRTSRRWALEEVMTTSIEKVKDYGWYWGNLSVEAAERILSNEPDGSFIVRDSSDDHYIFTLTFKLNGLRHVRIEHDQGNFCFGGCTMFKAQTIVEFIENAVETSRNGRYLFFLNLRPMLGPVRVQLLYPVSRFKRVQSLQHMCRFVILKCVRRDLVTELPLPRRILDYLNATHYYSELPN